MGGNRATTPAHSTCTTSPAYWQHGAFPAAAVRPLLCPGGHRDAQRQAPTSVVPDLHRADAERFPLVAQAGAAPAELAPGDAIYIPPLWFPPGRGPGAASERLMNCWWRPRPGSTDDLHLAAMRLAMLAFRHLPDGEREGWQALRRALCSAHAGQRSRTSPRAAASLWRAGCGGGRGDPAGHRRAPQALSCVEGQSKGLAPLVVISRERPRVHSGRAPAPRRPIGRGFFCSVAAVDSQQFST